MSCHIIKVLADFSILTQRKMKMFRSVANNTLLVATCSPELSTRFADCEFMDNFQTSISDPFAQKQLKFEPDRFLAYQNTAVSLG